MNRSIGQRYLVTERHNGSTRILSVAGDETQPMTAMAVERTLSARAYYWHTLLRHRVMWMSTRAFEVWSGQTIIAQVTALQATSEVVT